MIGTILLFLGMCVWNVVFFFFCGYWQQMSLNIDYGIDLFFGVLAIILLALGETSIIKQLHYRQKFRQYEKKVFDKKFVRQCALLIVFHIAAICFMYKLVYVQSVFYIAILAFVLSTGWLRGSKTLWMSKEASYFLNETGKLYNVESVAENGKAFELSCTRVGERDRIITIEKKKTIKDM